MCCIKIWRQVPSCVANTLHFSAWKCLRIIGGGAAVGLHIYTFMVLIFSCIHSDTGLQRCTGERDQHVLNAKIKTFQHAVCPTQPEIYDAFNSSIHNIFNFTIQCSKSTHLRPNVSIKIKINNFIKYFLVNFLLLQL